MAILQETAAKFESINFPSSPIYDSIFPEESGLAKALLTDSKEHKAVQPKDKAHSNQAQDEVRIISHPMNYAVAIGLRKLSTHHSACLDQFVASTIGLGLRNPREGDPEPGMPDKRDPNEEQDRVSDILDPLCEVSWEHLLDQAAKDQAATGEGYIEVSRDSNGSINGLYWVPSRSTYRTVYNDKFFHYIQLKEGTLSGNITFSMFDVPFSQFGKLEETSKPERSWAQPEESKSRRKDGAVISKMHELIEFQTPTVEWEHYGAPGYLSAVPYLQLVKQMIQQQSDHFHNRGIPDFLLFLLGVNMEEKEWNALKNTVKARVGDSNAGKAGVFNIGEVAENASVQLEQLSAGSDAAEHISKLHDAMALSICSAHRVPPILAGISVAGGMGTSNETVQALVLYENLVARQGRRNIERTLTSTLGHPVLGVSELAGPTGYKFRFASMLDDIDALTLDTMAKSKTDSMAQGDRDFSEGTLKRGRQS